MEENDFTLTVKLSPFAKKSLEASLNLCFDYLCSLERYSDAQLLDFAILAKLSGKFRTKIKDCPNG